MEEIPAAKNTKDKDKERKGSACRQIHPMSAIVKVVGMGMVMELMFRIQLMLVIWEKGFRARY